MDKDVLIFRRPAESPESIMYDHDIRISYNNFWVDFRDGKVIVTSNIAAQQDSGFDQAKGCDCPVSGFTVFHKQGCLHYE